jgi:hypothetical protein
MMHIGKTAQTTPPMDAKKTTTVMSAAAHFIWMHCSFIKVVLIFLKIPGQEKW